MRLWWVKMTAAANISTISPLNVASHTLFVCKTCASVWEEGKRVGESGGQKLLEQIQHLAQTAGSLPPRD